MSFLRKLFGKREPATQIPEAKPMGRLAIIEVECPHCGKATKATLPDDPHEREEEPEIKCEECGQLFAFTSGLLYRPIGYASEETKGRKPKPGRKLDPYVCMICGEQLEFGWMVPAFMQNVVAYHCRNCKNSICYKCAHTKKCIVCGGIHFDKSTGRPPLAETGNT